MVKFITKFASALKLSLFFLPMNVVLASNHNEIANIIAQEDAPFGVVFEVVEGSDDALEWAIPLINRYIQQLRHRFPELSVAVVSHGSEQFGLLKSEVRNNQKVHKSVQSLVSNNVPVHVCATHASWRDKRAIDFPDYVDVTPSGPSKIRDYQFMGYILIRIDSH